MGYGLGVVFKYVAVQFLRKFFLPYHGDLLCFISLDLLTLCLLLVAYNRTVFQAFFGLISKLFTVGNLVFNSAPRR